MTSDYVMINNTQTGVTQSIPKKAWKDLKLSSMGPGKTKFNHFLEEVPDDEQDLSTGVGDGADPAATAVDTKKKKGKE